LPQMLMLLQNLPMTLNGKLSRQSLPSPCSEDSDALVLEETTYNNVWPPSLETLLALILEVTRDAVIGRSGGTRKIDDASSVAVDKSALPWQEYGLNSTMSVFFNALLNARLHVQWPQHHSLIPPVPSSVMFAHPTPVSLAAFLRESCCARPSMSYSSSPNAARSAEIQHVVSLGTLCMTAQTMKALGLRRWPGPFDWIFTDPALVTHCLQDNFASLLNRSEYVEIDKKRVGHRLYSAMMQCEAVFDIHNPTLQQDYKFLSECVASFRRLLWDWPLESTERRYNTGRVLFLFFNLERRGPLSHAGTLQLFEQLCAQCRHPFQLLVINVMTTSGEAETRHQLLLHQRKQLHMCEGMEEHHLFVHELHCTGTHDCHYNFGEAADRDALHSIVLDGAVSSVSSLVESKRRYFDLADSPSAQQQVEFPPGQERL